MTGGSLKLQEAESWNVVVTLLEATPREARGVLGKWGNVARTPYYHVLTMTVPDPRAFLAEFAATAEAMPGLRNLISHVVPAQRTFDFSSPEEFEARAAEIAREWRRDLAGRSFHVRMHRRGEKHVLSTPKEERLLDTLLLTELENAGTPGRIAFDDPDCIIQIETVGRRAGMSLWTREELQRWPFLGVD